MKNFRKGQLAKFDILSVKWHGAKVVKSSQEEHVFPFLDLEHVLYTTSLGNLKQRFACARNEPVLILSGAEHCFGSYEYVTYYKVLIFNEYFWVNDVHLTKFSE